ncbi:LysR family transcriptional regulator [Pseudomonas sp. NPDC087358]|uniref:LysR family transcriptional regulator n=1 Tax=Pseudomonas sp. NPDC087358 TaxID=3364439 RepID=UPI0038501000
MLSNNSLRKIDVQDLMVFVAVYERNNLTQVSDALHVSPSTVSYCLKKLRIGFEDELFISTRSGMRPTRKATAMLQHVQQILQALDLCHSGLRTFDPGSQPWTFTVCAPEYFELLILPHLLRRFIASDYRVVINVCKPQKDLPVEALNDGRFDLALCFGPDFHRLARGLNAQTLLEDDLVCVADQQYAPDTPMINVDLFTARNHVYPTPWVCDVNMVDAWLSGHGRQRHIAARANTYGSALQLVHGTDCFLTLPRRVQALLGNEPWLAVRELPVDLPGFSLDMVWSERADQDEANGWLREQIVRVCADQGLL